MADKSYQALFPASTFVDVEEDSLDAVFVGNHNTPYRRRLASQLRLFLAHLRSLGLNSYEIWIDGSFTTVKPDPMDIDLVCFVPSTELAEMNDEQLDALEHFASTDGRAYVRERWSIDYYHCPFDSLEDRNYWKGLFSTDQFGTQKGIGRIKR